MHRLAGRLLAAALLLGLSAVQGQVLTLHYQERPPYSSRSATGQVLGLVAEPAAQALAAAGVAFRWVETPSQRQLALIQSGQGLHCGVGWFRTDERAARGRFSRPLYRDQPFGALVRDDRGLPSSLRAAELLAEPSLKLLVKDGYSYGPVLDALIAQAARPVERTSVEPLQMRWMLLSNRADWMIVAPEEAAMLAAPGLRLVRFADVPAGPARHLYCSSDLPQAWLDGIDRALPPLPR